MLERTNVHPYPYTRARTHVHPYPYTRTPVPMYQRTNVHTYQRAPLKSVLSTPVPMYTRTNVHPCPFVGVGVLSTPLKVY